jgi:uncharacterized membrane protein YgcG
MITVFVLALVLFIFSGSTVAVNIGYAAVQATTLPRCTDPTGQNLPCMMVISTLPPPPNALQCQETTGQILSCSYATQTLSNGQQVVVITIYAPANFVFSPGIVKVVVHKTEKTVINNIIRVVCPPFVFCPQHHTGNFLAGYDLGSQDGSVGVYDPVAACAGKTGAALEHCYTGYKDAYLTACHKSHFGCGDGPTTCPPGENPNDCYVPTGGLPPGPPICNGPHPPHVLVACPGITSIPTSGGVKGSGSTCGAGNCTSATPPPVDCTKNPTDPSCTQTLTPSTSTPPTTKTCPDGSVIDASANCPTQSTPPTNPNTPSTPSSTSGTPPSSNNPPPSSSNNGGGGSSSGSGGSGSGSGGGSGPSQPTTVS